MNSVGTSPLALPLFLRPAKLGMGALLSQADAITPITSRIDMSKSIEPKKLRLRITQKVTDIKTQYLWSLQPVERTESGKV